MAHSSDLDLNEKDITGLGSADAVASFFTKLGYDTSDRAALTPEALGLAGDSAKALKRIELLSEDSEQFLRVVFLDKRRKESKGPAGIERVQVVPKTISLDRRRPSRLDLRTPAAIHLDLPGCARPVRQAPQRLRSGGIHRRILPEPGTLLRLLPAGTPA